MNLVCPYMDKNILHCGFTAPRCFQEKFLCQSLAIAISHVLNLDELNCIGQGHKLRRDILIIFLANNERDGLKKPATNFYFWFGSSINPFQM